MSSPKGGRPSLGPRRQVSSRVHPALADAFEAEATDLGRTYNDHLAHLLAERYGLLDFSPVVEADELQGVLTEVA